MAFLIAISPLGRPEGFVFLLIAAVALIGHRKFTQLIILPLGLIVWSMAGHLIIGPASSPWWRWLIDHWPYEGGSAYPAGHLLYFVAVLPVLVGPIALPALLVGIGRNLAPLRNLRKTLLDSITRVDFLIAGLPLAVLVGHALLSWLGKMSSAGSLRYLLIVAPLWGVLIARGWELVFTKFNWRRPVEWAALAVILPTGANYMYRVIPMQQSLDWREAEQVVDWYSKDPIRHDYPRIMSNHPGIFFYLDASPWDRAKVEPWTADAITKPPAGVLLVWDPKFIAENSDPKMVVSLKQVIDSGWVNDPKAELESNPPDSKKALPDDPGSWHLFLSPDAADGSETPVAARNSGDQWWQQLSDERTTGQ